MVKSCVFILSYLEDLSFVLFEQLNGVAYVLTELDLLVFGSILVSLRLVH